MKITNQLDNNIGIDNVNSLWGYVAETNSNFEIIELISLFKILLFIKLFFHF